MTVAIDQCLSVDLDNILANIEEPRKLDLSDFPRSDAGNAELFAAVFSDRARYDHTKGRWLVWNGHYWRNDVDGQVYRYAIEAARLRARTALESPSNSDSRYQVEWALASESLAKLKAMLELARTHSDIADGGPWDANRLLLGCENGTVDLRTGELRPGQRADHITMSTAQAYDANATCPTWKRVVSEVFEGNSELVTYVQRALGYSLTGLQSEQRMFIAYGSGSNGKSTLFNAARKALGDYGGNAGFGTLEKQRRASNAATADLVTLEGKRFITVAEVNEDCPLDEGRVKSLTGGDAIQVRGLYENARSIEFHGTFWLFLNHLPKVDDMSVGLWRRLHVVPFNRRFTGSEIDKDLDRQLAGELPGILAWLVQGAVMWFSDGLQAPQCVTDAVDEYQADSDPLGDWLTTCAVLGDGPDFFVKSNESFASFQKREEHEGIPHLERMSHTAFGKRMKDRFKRHKKNGVNVYLGVRLRTPADDAREEQSEPAPVAPEFDDQDDGSHLF